MRIADRPKSPLLAYLNKHWFAGYVVVMALSSITLFYVPLHLVLGVPLAKLLEPYGAVCLVSLPMARVLYWLHPIFMRNRDARPVYLVLSLYWLFLGVLIVFYGQQLGFFDANNSTRNYLLAISVALITPWIGYHLWSKFIAPRWPFPTEQD